MMVNQGKSLARAVGSRLIGAEEDELLVLAKDGDQGAFEQLVHAYQRIIRMHARRYFLQGAEYEDLIQEAMLGFFKAVRDYRADSGSFRTFAELCINRQVITAVKAASRLKHLPLNSAHSLEAPRYRGDDDGRVSDGLGDPRAVFEPTFLQSEEVKGIMAVLQQRLSIFEYSALLLWLDGHSYQEIGKRLAKPLKSVDNGLWRVKCKIRRLLAAGVIAAG